MMCMYFNFTANEKDVIFKKLENIYGIGEQLSKLNLWMIG